MEVTILGLVEGLGIQMCRASCFRFGAFRSHAL